MRALLDANIIDFLVADAEALRVLERALADRRLTLIVTHLLADEIAATTDPERFALLEPVRHRLSESSTSVPTAGAVWDISRWDDSEWMCWMEAEGFLAVTADNPRHAEDALLIFTARERVPLILRTVSGPGSAAAPGTPPQVNTPRSSAGRTTTSRAC
jgi:hypothetical protein